MMMTVREMKKETMMVKKKKKTMTMTWNSAVDYVLGAAPPEFHVGTVSVKPVWFFSNWIGTTGTTHNNCTCCGSAINDMV
eukprot:scaffold124353_cov49-Attheya_sp.AAC.1